MVNPLALLFLYSRPLVQSDVLDDPSACGAVQSNNSSLLPKHHFLYSFTNNVIGYLRAGFEVPDSDTPRWTTPRGAQPLWRHKRTVGHRAFEVQRLSDSSDVKPV